MPRSILWFRRDLRLADNPALLAAADAGPGGVLPLFVLDPALWGPAGDVRRAYLVASLRALDTALDGGLRVLSGDPTGVVPAAARALGAATVHVATDFGPYGSARDRAVAAALARDDRALVRTGSPYAVAPGRVRTGNGTPYQVFTPFHRAWLAHGWRRPAASAGVPVRWAGGPGEGVGSLPEPAALGTSVVPPAGEVAALDRWRAFAAAGLGDYALGRDRPDLAGTSGLSTALRWGEVHPRTLLAGLGNDRDASAFRRQLAWREFYADVLGHRPGSARACLRPGLAAMELDGGPAADAALAAWRDGRTGYPFVDAGMRQLRDEGWMHNRLRMVTASFLVKDLHLDWRTGARWFMRMLRDGDLASNQHGWQWVAGTGTDAAPYFRVLNPVAQGRRLDPAGAYVRRYVPELAHMAGPDVHEPWTSPGGLPDGYPERIVDHAEERTIALARYARVTRAGRA